jgi:hypothetical protein
MCSGAFLFVQKLMVFLIFVRQSRFRLQAAFYIALANLQPVRQDVGIAWTLADHALLQLSHQ